MMERYDPQAIEAKWQRVWEDEQAFLVPNPGPGDATGREQDLRRRDAPVPLGRAAHGPRAQLHDRRRRRALAPAPRLRRCCGRWATTRSACPPRTRRSGRAAIRARSTERNIADDPRADEAHGLGDRLVRASSRPHDPTYYRWTQWLFLRFFEQGLAYRKEAPVKWCPKDQTVLANEQVIDGHCERCGTEVEARNLTQWFFTITDYADELLDEMELLEQWPERVLTMQRNWIGRSEGARVLFRVDGLRRGAAGVHDAARTRCSARRSSCWRPSTRSSTQLVAGTEHEDEVREYVRHAARAHGRRARGEGEGRRLHRPLRGQPGQRRADPDLGRRLRPDGVRHRRDHGRAGARRARLRVRGAVRAAGPQVVAPADGEDAPEDGAFVAHTENEVLVNSGEFTRPAAPEGKRAIVEWLAERGLGEATVGYRLRDWLLSRQRYWGCPIPIVHCERCGEVPVPDERAARPAARDRGVPAEGALAAGRGGGLGARRLPEVRRRGAARDRHDGHVRRLVLVLPALLRPAERRASRSRASSSTTGCRSTSTSAASSTRSCTCSTRASSRR